MWTKHAVNIFVLFGHMPWFRQIRVEGSSRTFSDLDDLKSAIEVYCQDPSNDQTE